MTKQQLIKAIEALGFKVEFYDYYPRIQEVCVGVEGVDHYVTENTKQGVLDRFKGYKVPTDILEAVELAENYKKTNFTKLSVEELSDKMFFENLSAEDAA